MSDPAEYASGFDDEVAATVRGAADRVPRFRSRLQEAGIDPGDLDGVGALDRLPVVSKDEVLEAQRDDPPFGGMIAPDADVRRIFQSPGPLYEPELDRDDPWRWAAALRAAGFGPDDLVLNAFGYHLSPAGAMFEEACLAIGARVVPAGVGNKDLQVAACADLGVTAYIGTPSYLNALLEAAEGQDAQLGIERAFVSAEPLPPSLRATLQEQVGVVRQGYGTAETGLLGYECEEEAGLHVPTDALVQVADLTTGDAIVDDTEGQVIVTLFESAYPIVRFGTGDLSRWILDPCGCGEATPRLAGWLGRVGDAVKVRGMFLHPQQVAEVLDDLDGIERYRMVVAREEHRDELRCEVVTSGPEGEALAERVRAAIREGLRFNAEVVVVDSLPEDAPALTDERSWE